MRSSAACIGAALALLLCLALPAYAEEPPSIRFVWALLQRSEDGTARALDCSPEVISLQPADRIRIWLMPLTPCWFYLYLHDAQGRVTLLVPADPLAAATGPPGVGRFVPDAQTWFRLDLQPGTEVLYLVLSDRRLPPLEAVTRAGIGAVSPTRPYRPLDHPSDVLQEIRRLIVQSSGLLRPAEQPVPVAGDFRGLEVESGFAGLLIEARGLYVRSFRLQH